MSFVNTYTPPNKRDIDVSFMDPYDLNSTIPVLPILESDRVCLVPFNPAIHAEAFHMAYVADIESIDRYFPVDWSTIDAFLAFLESFIRQDHTSVLFAIIDKTRPSENPALIPQGRVAGVIGWAHGSLAQLSMEFGPVVVLTAFQRTFVSANAIGLLLKYVLDTPEEGGLGFRRVAWCTNPMNVASIGAAEKMGFTKEGVVSEI
ncbi:unnamed protein product [Cyclocybe aegerita]|uniref:N-acetyltransferase domain-containing protein n=1 Tax=Cyclocybe aegerita TaxID=1973307 RepID=A0A8S0WM40_CYCAE|nr:unnamed protein product [Cyclocybe aegerita]